MRSGTIAFLFGALAVAHAPHLPAIGWVVVPAALLVCARRWPWLRPVLWLAAGVLWTWWRAELLLSHELDPRLDGETVTVTGVIRGLPREGGRGIRFDFSVDELAAFKQRWRVPGLVTLTWPEAGTVLVPGERWRLVVRMRRPRGFQNPGGFDYEGWLFQHGVRATGYVVASPRNCRLEPPHGELVHRLRQDIQSRLLSVLPDSPHRGIVNALAIGATDDVTSADWNVLRRTGTSHLISISGLHVALVAGLGFVAGRWLWSLHVAGLRRVAAQRVGGAVSLLAALLYAGLAGFSVPTQRTVIMIAAALVATWSGSRPAASEVLAIALLAVLVWDPLAVLSAGLWLSFGAVAVILYCTCARPLRPPWWWQAIRVHLAVAVGLAPILCALFGQNPVLGPVANVVAVPWVSFLVVPLVLAGSGLLYVFEPAGAGFVSLAVGALDLIWPFLDWVARRDVALWSRPAPAAWMLVASVVGVGLLCMPRGLPGRWLGLVWLTPLLLADAPRPPPGEFWFTLLDVGQGLAAVARTQFHTVVFDTGPRLGPDFDTGRAVVAPFLRSIGVARVDQVIISHGDNDHGGGLASLLDEIPVDVVMTQAAIPPGGEPQMPCVDGASWTWDGVTFQTFRAGIGPAGRNNDSCLLRVSNARHAVLLTGDIEAPAETRLTRMHGAALRADVLIAPHHGSKTSSTAPFIETVAPAYVLFPAAYRNRFGFPHADVLERYAKRNVHAFITGESGAISFDVGMELRGPTLHRRANARFWHVNHFDWSRHGKEKSAARDPSAP